MVLYLNFPFQGKDFCFLFQVCLEYHIKDVGEMDQLDQSIIELLLHNGRISLKEIAQAVNLTSPAVSARIRHLEENGIIAGYTVLLRAPQEASQVESLISVSVKPGSHQEFMDFLHDTPQVEQCYHVTGAFSHMVKVRCRDIPQLEHLISRLQHFGSTNSQIILSTPVERPMQPIKEGSIHDL